MRAVISMATLCVLIASPANAVRPDECEQQRAAFPKEWNDVSKEKPVFFCSSHYSGAFKVTLGAGDKDGRRLMSLVQLFLFHRYKVDSVHFVTPTEDNQRQAEGMKALGFFGSVVQEVGEIIVADVNKARVKELLAPDRVALKALIAKE